MGLFKGGGTQVSGRARDPSEPSLASITAATGGANPANTLSPPPLPPQFSASATYRSGAAQRRKSAGGFSSTILTGAGGLSPPAQTAPKSLLGM